MATFSTTAKLYLSIFSVRLKWSAVSLHRFPRILQWHSQIFSEVKSGAFLQASRKFARGGFTAPSSPFSAFMACANVWVEWSAWPLVARWYWVEKVSYTVFLHEVLEHLACELPSIVTVQVFWQSIPRANPYRNISTVLSEEVDRVISTFAHLQSVSTTFRNKWSVS